MRLIPIIALAALVATPAFAGGAKKKKMHMQSQGYYQVEPGWRGARNEYRRGGGDYLSGPEVYSAVRPLHRPRSLAECSPTHVR